MSESKRFECVFVEDDEFGGTFRRLKDNETNITYMVCDVADLLNFQNTQIKILKDENEQLQEKIEMDKNDFFISEAKRMRLLAFIEDNGLRKEYYEWERRIWNE